MVDSIEGNDNNECHLLLFVATIIDNIW